MATSPHVRVWVASVPDWRPTSHVAWATLDRTEQARADTFRRSADAERYVMAHALLREALGQTLHADPRAIRVDGGWTGAPRCDEPESAGLRLSLSHAGSLAIVAIADAVDVGVDVEPIDPRRADPAVAARFLPPGDVAMLLSCSPEERPRTMATAWTRLEAEAKGRGASLDALRGQVRSGMFEHLDVGDAHVATLWTAERATVVRACRPLLASAA
jgi:4'-phosphopantetheinyl transferase